MLSWLRIKLILSQLTSSFFHIFILTIGFFLLVKFASDREHVPAELLFLRALIIHGLACHVFWLPYSSEEYAHRAHVTWASIYSNLVGQLPTGHFFFWIDCLCFNLYD
jgi:hypothetical protein